MLNSLVKACSTAQLHPQHNVAAQLIPAQLTIVVDRQLVRVDILQGDLWSAGCCARHGHTSKRRGYRVVYDVRYTLDEVSWKADSLEFLCEAFSP